MKKIKFNKKHFTLVLSYIILTIGIFFFTYSSYNIFKWYVDSQNTNKIISKIHSINVSGSGDLDSNSLNAGIDLSEYKKINPETVGWIKVNGTNVDYPFVQTIDNNFYLKHSFDRSFNSAGWVFLDYRNDINNFNKNTILYAHGRLDKTMFGSLDNLFDSNWLANTNNHIISISTEDQTTKWQIFSIYHIPVTNDYIQTNFESDEEFMSFIDKIKSRSNYNFNINFTESDNILTLSTCYKNNSKERLVIHAKRDHYEVHPKC